MSEYDNQDLDSLEQELREKLRKLEEYKRQKEIERLEAEMKSKKITITVSSLYGSYVVFELSDLRDDVINDLKAIKGYSYRTSYQKMIPIAEWKQLETIAVKYPGIVTINFSEGLRKKLDEILEEPAYYIDLIKQRDNNLYSIKIGYFGNKYLVQQHIPTAVYDMPKDRYTVPISEGWRLVEVFKEEDNAVFSEEAKAHIIKQIEDRGRLDVIAKLEESPIIREKLSSKDEVGVKISKALRPFQAVDIEFSDVAGGRYLNANEMGLGKTLEALSYAYLHNCRTVIICPASLMYNWSREIHKWLGADIKVALMSGSVPSKFDMMQFLVEKVPFIIINYDIISRAKIIEKELPQESGRTLITREERFLWVDLINLAQPDLLIVDEAHYIKNVDSNRSRGIRKISVPKLIFLTGTPVLNRPGELWPILTMLRPDEFPHYETFLRQYTYDGKRARNIDQLRELLRPLMIRRRKKDVIKELPPINRINEYYELTGKGRKLYDKVLQGLYEEVAAFNPNNPGAEKEVANILVQIIRCKQVCAIAMAEFTADKAIELYDSGSDNGPDHKVLIFTQFKPVAYSISRRLVNEGTLCFVDRTDSGFQTVDGQKRDELVYQFQNDPNIKYMVVTEKTTKEGMNITAAQSVIFNDLFWTPAGHEQAEGRAYGRLSDLHSINSYYMVFEDTIMDWILELLAFKTGVIEETVEGVESSRDSSVAMKLIDKIKQSIWTRGKK